MYLILVLLDLLSPTTLTSEVLSLSKLKSEEINTLYTLTMSKLLFGLTKLVTILLVKSVSIVTQITKIMIGSLVSQFVLLKLPKLNVLTNY